MRKRQGAASEHVEALPEAAPTDLQALEALRTLRAWLGAGATLTPASYDADHLPRGITRDAFLRRHRARLRAGVPGWTRVGHGRVVTGEAWALDVEAETAGSHRRRAVEAQPVASAANDVSAELDRALGIRTAGGRR